MKKILLTQEKFALVDDEDFESIFQHKYCANKIGNTYYAIRRITIKSQNQKENTKRKMKMILMHRIILEYKLKRKLKHWENTDHINGNGLDNRRCNLRLCDQSKNGGNRKKQNKKTSSIYKGVSWSKRCKKWRTQIKVNKKPRHIGYFESETKAGKAYDEAAIKYFGEFARLNFNEKE